MNTADVAHKLGVSTKTVQRWVKQLQIPASRNELGHYSFTDDDMTILEKVKEQLKNGISMQDIIVQRKKKSFLIERNDNSLSDHPKQFDEWLDQKMKQYLQHEQLERQLLQKKMAELERKLEQKADEVVSYQLLQQRRDLEEERQQIKDIKQKISELENNQAKEKDTIPLEEKPKSRFKSIFSF
ncbi:MerR family transcriptional regulator [Bacillus sp. CLL-7-23]|uniref:Chromosome-anchoring protein RacA n=1 Tax=Bacillus changyiensis TaxID=3004103 RepID=A0ABT4WZT0_9BACI|nr:MerR family transcriptional regulator [Bacillus changyiensis]MDA7025377.1 MerR family transcriptional regulator [Bacillus changyiensis]